MSRRTANSGPSAHRLSVALLLALACAGLPAHPAWAKVDIFDRGPALIAGKFNLRVSNAGIFGNPFPDLSTDPSFEYPQGSGQELMHYAALWVGALDEHGDRRVSGGPLLEFRPTTAAEDTVRGAWHGRFGGQRTVDDDGDGAIDEEILNNRDDDGDGEIDEDLGLIGQQMLTADYTDDQPEAVRAVYPGDVAHQPLGLSVHQEAYAWSWPGYDGIAGLQFTITNHGTTTLHELYIGLYVDLDVRTRDSRAGHTNDAIARAGFSRSFFKGNSRIFVDGLGIISEPCFNRVARTLPVVVEPAGNGNPNLPVVTVLPLEHTRDALSYFVPSAGRAPARDTFQVSVFSADRTWNTGGPPVIDADRYAALTGMAVQSPDDFVGDQVLLLSCGPFHRLAPGQSLNFAAALVAAPNLDSLKTALGNAAFLYNGTELNLLPDATGPFANWWITGPTGINGHEACVEPPPGVEFVADPNCSLKYYDPTGESPRDPPRIEHHLYHSGECYWSDADCDNCTGLSGRETILRWLDPFEVPPPPACRVTVGDRGARVEWDNLPEILITAGKAGPKDAKFIGYRVYRLSDWRRRTSLLPPRENWEALATYGFDERDSKLLLASATDTTLDYTRIWYEQKQYPIGRYAMSDSLVKNGFDYLYLVTTLVEVTTFVGGRPRVHHYESPLVATFDQRVTPRAESQADAHGVWVVPNPFRASADWDRPGVYGDRPTRHLDFMGLPRTHCVIRIWTVSGDHVATLRHDGSGGDGQAAWDLISRNGEEVASGVYIYTVESSLGNSKGRFVVIR